MRNVLITFAIHCSWTERTVMSITFVITNKSTAFPLFPFHMISHNTSGWSVYIVKPHSSLFIRSPPERKSIMQLDSPNKFLPSMSCECLVVIPLFNIPAHYCQFSSWHLQRPLHSSVLHSNCPKACSFFSMWPWYPGQGALWVIWCHAVHHIYNSGWYLLW